MKNTFDDRNTRLDDTAPANGVHWKMRRMQKIGMRAGLSRPDVSLIASDSCGLRYSPWVEITHEGRGCMDSRIPRAARRLLLGCGGCQETPPAEAHIGVAKAAGLLHGRDFEHRSDPMHLQGATGY